MNAQDRKAWEDFVEGIDYKPNAKFTVHYDPRMDAMLLRLAVSTLDSRKRGTGAPTVITASEFIGYNMTVSNLGREDWLIQARSFVRYTAHRVEAHEADEWLLFAGEMTFNPHGDSVTIGRDPRPKKMEIA